MSVGFDPNLAQREQARTVVREFLRYVHENRRSWRVLYRVAIGTAAFTSRVMESRQRITEMVAGLIRAGTTVEGAADIDFELTALAIVGATGPSPTASPRVTSTSTPPPTCSSASSGAASRVSAPTAPPPSPRPFAHGTGYGARPDPRPGTGPACTRRGQLQRLPIPPRTAFPNRGLRYHRELITRFTPGSATG